MPGRRESGIPDLAGSPCKSLSGRGFQRSKDLNRMLSMMARAMAITLAAAGAAAAGQCEANFTVVGVPLVTGLTFSTVQDLPGVDPATATGRIARKLRREGYLGVEADSGRGRVDAWQETSGSGRSQHLRATVKPTKAGSRAALSFTVRAGQVADDRIVRKELCKLLRAGG